MFSQRKLGPRVFIASSLILAMHSLPHLSSVTAQESCEDIDRVEAARTYQAVKLQQFGIQVSIPSNYRTLEREGGLWIIDRGTFNLLQCIDKGIPVLGTDALNPQIFRQQPNPLGLSAQAFAAQSEYPLLSPTVFRHRVDETDVFIREGIEGRGRSVAVSYAWYQSPAVEGMIEVSVEGTKADLLNLLKQSTMIPVAVEDGPSREIRRDPIDVALGAVREQGGGFGRRRTIVAENDSLEHSQRSTVTITEEGFGDDSVRGYRYILQMLKEANGNWTVAELQKSWVCHVGRGSQVYARELCH